jgi:hypothetical protein
MNGRTSASSELRPLISYSLAPSILLNIVLTALPIAYGGYQIMRGDLPTAWILGGLGIADTYYLLWRRNVRFAKFFEDHFEIVGYGVDVKGDYRLIENLTVFRRNFGDFQSNTRVSFSIRGDTNIFTIPNRKNRNLGLDVYSLIKNEMQGN